MNYSFLSLIFFLVTFVGGVSLAQNSGVAPDASVGAHWTPEVQPIVVSIHSLTGLVPDTLHITDLEHPTARKTCGGEGAPLVVFYDHGVPVTNLYAPQGAPTGFVEVRYDHDNNGIPDGTVLALDLQNQTDVWITWGQANDLTIRYLRPGQRIQVEVKPGHWEYQSVYHSTQRNEASPSGAIGCDMDPLERRGGHRKVAGYSMSRLW